MLRHSNRGFACEQGWNAAGQPVSQRAGFFPEEATWGGWFPHWYGSTVTTTRVTCQASPAGKITDGKHGGSTGWTGTASHGGDSLRHRAGLWRRRWSYGYDSCGYLKAQSAGRHRIK